MKNPLGCVFILLLAITFGAGVAAPASAATVGRSGYTDAPYWFSAIDASGQFAEPLDMLFQNSAQYVIYRPGIAATYIVAAHPNYEPDTDDQTTAQTITLITTIQSYGPSDVLEDCTVGGTFQVPASYVRTTPANIPYLQFSITFTTYNAQTGAVVMNTFNPAYFALDVITSVPLP
jgi:hypothetical protein